MENCICKLAFGVCNWTVIVQRIFGMKKYANICEKLLSQGGKPKNHVGPQGGRGVKNYRKSVHMVYGCRLISALFYMSKGNAYVNQLRIYTIKKSYK